MTNNPGFHAQLTDLGLKFILPEGYEEIPVKKNRDLHYSYAIFNHELGVEMRYSIFPLAPMIQLYEQSKNNPGMVMIMA
jgi:hypothetical protein